ncbi:MAG: TIGR03619 family F420-dependent LLM class oxidoreductase [Actinobacteria bacterium]|nr:TIGR03619 family F420-dependent LLM class oxidoreductase [Actinomycetota bacterium]
MKFAQALIGADPLDWPQVAAAAEDAGFDSVAVSDHVVYPSYLTTKYPYTPDGTPQFSPDEDWPDPWVAIGAMSATTSTLRFLTNVYVLPMRNPFVIAKAVGTAAFMSRGRVGLGVGAGWMVEEFELLGQPFAGRGKRLEETVEVIRTLWRGGMVEHHGELYDFAPVEMRPVPPAPVPIYIGGQSEVAFRRAAAIGDGWLGMYCTADELVGHCATIRQAREDAGTADRPFEVIASPLVIPTPDMCDRLGSAGVTTILTSAWMAQGVERPESTEQAIDLIGTFGERFIA